MATQVFKIEGLKELDEALKELPKKATARAVIRRAFLKAVAPVEAQAKALAPRRTGRLAESIVFGTKLSKRQRRLHRSESDVEFFVGPAALPHAHLQEFGTRHHPPRPFMRPAWDTNKMQALNTVAGFLRDEIEKTRARIARRAERLAAQIAAGK
jgi:HK97 gp10 family phage protein